MKSRSILITLITMQLLHNISQAQETFKYSYDETGNRIKRELVTTMSLMPTTTDSIEVELLFEPYTASLLPNNNDVNGQDAFKVQVYPNPSNGIYTIELLDLQVNEKGMLQVYSLMGQLVQEYRSLHTIQSINISGVVPGYYLLRVVLGDKIVQKTLIKQ